MVQQPIQNRCRQYRIPHNLTPFPKTFVGSENDRGMFGNSFFSNSNNFGSQVHLYHLAGFAQSFDFVFQIAHGVFGDFIRKKARWHRCGQMPPSFL
jgi:hypothetical protein